MYIDKHPSGSGGQIGSGDALSSPVYPAYPRQNEGLESQVTHSLPPVKGRREASRIQAANKAQRMAAKGVSSFL